MNASERDQLIATCAETTVILFERKLVRRAWLFGSVIYKGGVYFERKTSDVDILFHFGENHIEPFARVKALIEIAPELLNLDEKLRSLDFLKERTTPLVSANAFGPFVWKHGLFNWADPLFQKRNKYIDLLNPNLSSIGFTSAPGPSGYRFMGPKFADATHSLIEAHGRRKLFFSEFLITKTPETLGDIELDWLPPVSKELQRAAARLGAYSRRTQDESAYDVNQGLHYLTGLIQELERSDNSYQPLCTAVAARQGGRGEVLKKKNLLRKDELLLWEILAYYAEAFLDNKKPRKKHLSTEGIAVGQRRRAAHKR